MALSAGELTQIGIQIGMLGGIVKILVDARKANGKDGNGKACVFHTSIVSRLATVETEKEGLAKEVGILHGENREEHRQIFTEIKSLAMSAAIASEAARTAASAAATAVAARRES